MFAIRKGKIMLLLVEEVNYKDLCDGKLLLNKPNTRLVILDT